MIIHEIGGGELYIPEDKIIWARAKDGVLEIAIHGVHGLTNYWSWETSEAHEIVDELSANEAAAEFVEGE